MRVSIPLANCTYVVIKPEPSLPLRYGRKNRFSAKNNHDTEFSKLEILYIYVPALHSLIVMVVLFPPIVNGQSPAEASMRIVSLPSETLSSTALIVTPLFNSPSENCSNTI